MFSQEETDMKTFIKELKKKSEPYKGKVDFQKAQLFFARQEWDSTLFYSMKQLNFDTNKELNDYCHYFRAVSFIKKNFSSKP